MRTSLGKAAAAFAAVVMLLNAVPASAQTQGMERRHERRSHRVQRAQRPERIRIGSLTCAYGAVYWVRRVTRAGSRVPP